MKAANKNPFTLSTNKQQQISLSGLLSAKYLNETNQYATQNSKTIIQNRSSQ